MTTHDDKPKRWSATIAALWIIVAVAWIAFLDWLLGFNFEATIAAAIIGPVVFVAQYFASRSVPPQL